MAEAFNNAFDNLAIILMFLSFVGMSFLLISATVSLIGQFVKDNHDGWLIFLETFVFALEVALAAVFVDIHRRGVGVLVGFKNFWHFATILAVIFMTFQIERTSIAYGLSYLQEHYMKKDALAYQDSDRYKSALEAKAKARQKIAYWEDWKGTEADLLMLTQLKAQYDKAVKEKAFRLKAYQHATTKKADAAIKDALEKMKKIEAEIERKKEKNIALYSKVEKMAIDQIEHIRRTSETKQKHAIISFSKQAEEWAHNVVAFMALIYFIHGILIVVSEDGFVMKEWLTRLFPILEEKIDKIENEAKKIIGEEGSPNVIKFEPPKAETTELTHGDKISLLKKVIAHELRDQLERGGANMPGFAAPGRDKLFRRYNQMRENGEISEGLSRKFIADNLADVNPEMIARFREILEEKKRALA